MYLKCKPDKLGNPVVPGMKVSLMQHQLIGVKWMAERENKQPHQVALKVSSIVISTNCFGDFSKCSVVTDLISDSKLRKLADVAQELWQKFIHQPQTARCLVFLLILGLLCQEIARRYEDAVNHFVRLLNLKVYR